MSFFAVFLALLIEQAYPLPAGNWVYAIFRNWVRRTQHNLDAGRGPHGWLICVLAIGLPTVLTGLVYWLLCQFNPLFAFVWNVVVLYLTLGFRQFSHYFTHIREALEENDEATARTRLAQWCQVDATELPRQEILRHVIEHAALSAHRHVFGVLGWFSVLAALGLGPSGAVLYRLSEFAARYWHYKSQSTSARPDEGPSPALQSAAQQIWGVIDFVPAHMTALGFAVVGSFEDAVDAVLQNHRQHSASGGAVNLSSRNDTMILAATGGAVNVCLGQPTLPSQLSAGPPGVADITPAPLFPRGLAGREPQLAHLRSMVGLVWRSVVLWMVLLALLTLARLLG